MTYIELHKESSFMQMYASFPGLNSGGARRASSWLLQRTTRCRAYNIQDDPVLTQVSAMWLFLFV